MSNKPYLKKSVKAVTNIINNLDLPDERRGLFEQGGRFIACDLVRFVRLTNDMPEVKHTTYQLASDVSTIIDETNKYDYYHFELPTVKELRDSIREQRESGRSRSDMTYNLDNISWVNPCYLLDMLEALPKCRAYKRNTWNSFIYFKTENGDDGVLFPRRPPNV